MKRVVMGFGLAALAASAVGCGMMRGVGSRGSPTVGLISSPDVPAAQGAVAVKMDENGNTRVNVTVKHLAPASKVKEGTAQYIVWARPLDGPDRRPQNLGTLRVDGDLNGSLDAVTPLRQFDIFVTAEPLRIMGEPTGEQLLFARVSGQLPL